MPALQSSRPLTRRLVPALAVTLVATLVFGAVVVTADAAGGEDPLLPPTFGVASPQRGDAWRYNATLAGDWTFADDDVVKAGEAFPFLTMQWAGPGVVRGGDGLMHDAELLHSEGVLYAPGRLYEEGDLDQEQVGSPITGRGEEGNTTLVRSRDPYWVEGFGDDWVVAGGDTVVNRGFRSSENHTDVYYGPGGAPLGLGSEYRAEFFEMGFEQYPVDEVPCLAFNPLQGTSVNLTGSFGLFDECLVGGESFLHLPAGLAFTPRAVETVGGVEAIRFDAKANGTFQAWFTPAVPYPVRLAFSLPSEVKGLPEAGDLDLPGARSAVIEMVGFTAGAEALDPVDDPADTDPAPALAQAPPLTVPYGGRDVRVGPDETGVEHSFPLSVAFRAALNDTQFNDLRLTLQAYPDAYVAGATYVEGRPAGFTPTQQVPSYTQSWLIAVSNGGDDLYTFAAMKDTYEREAAPGVVGALNLSSTLHGLPAYTYSFSSYAYPDNVRLPLPFISQLPDTLPTARSLMDRWAAFDGSGTPANGWGFAYSCGEEEACKATVTSTAGHVRQQDFDPFTTSMPPMPGNPWGTEGYVEIERTVDFLEDGTATLLRVRDMREYRSSGSITPGHAVGGHELPTSASDPGYHVASVEVAGIPSSTLGWLPEGKQAAGVGFLGLVVGFLYWIWPKLGLMGLFSRLDRGELLEHPARARLVQIVESQPGIHFHDLAQKAELANGTAVHHLRKLSDAGHLTVRRSGRYTCYFPGSRVDPHTAAAAPLLKSDGARQVLEAVRSRPGLSNLEVAQATGLQPSTVNYHVQRLSQAGLVAALRDGRMVRLHPGAHSGSLPTAAA